MMEDQLEVQSLEAPATVETEAAPDDLLDSAGYFVRTDLRADGKGCYCDTHGEMIGDDCPQTGCAHCV